MNTVEALKKLDENKDIVEKIKAEAKTPEDVYEVLKGIGLTDDFDTFISESAKYVEAYSKLSAEEIDSLSGGGSSGTLWTTMTFTTVPIAGGLAGI
ncbi:MAG: hypothetical protein Q4B67_07660 [Eubacteriales bacterium]|nr:hypothetical protein [Eubacteriales bacterium]